MSGEQEGAAGGAAVSREWIRSLPKVELHVHLEGSMRPALLLELAQRHGVELPAADITGLSRWFQFRSFEHFVEIYLKCSECLKDPEDFRALALDFAEQQALQGVVYSEVHFTISTHLANGADGDAVAEALWEAVSEAESRWGTVVRWIPDIVRNLGPERADWTVEWALQNQDRGVVALGVAGIETGADVPFVSHADAAREGGLHVVAHAGEQRGPEAVWSALDVLGAERIGHAVSALQDPGLVERLVSDGIPVECCPSSNVELGYAANLEEHPIEPLRRTGVEVSINSDDPPLFGTTLLDEYLRVAEAFAYERSAVEALVQNATRHSFLATDERN